MFDENLFEEFKNQNYKLENELKVKLENEKHLIYENECLYSENNKLLEIATQDKNEISKLKNKIQKLEGDSEEMTYLKNLTEKLSNENEKMKKDLDEQIKLNKEMSKPVKLQFESPSAKLRQIEYKYKCQIQDLTEENKVLKVKLEQQSNLIDQMKSDVNKEIEIFKSKIENYKELLQEEKKEKEEIECEYLTLQNEMNKPDFNRQGNNMYKEVEDRRVLAEKAVLAYQEEYLRLRETNANLTSYLEKAFDAFSELKEEELSSFKRDMLSKNANLTRQNEALKKEFDQLNNFITNEYNKYSQGGMNESLAVRNLRVQLNVNKSKTKTLERDTDESIREADKAKEKLFKLYSQNERMTKENASLKTKIEKYESRLDWFDRVIPKDKLKEYEEEHKKVEASLKARAEKNRKSEKFLPPQIFGQQYALAKFSDKLVFDPNGVPIENKLTRRIMGSSNKDMDQKVEDKKENDATNPKTPQSVNCCVDLHSVTQPVKTLHESSQNKSTDMVSDKLVFDPSENILNKSIMGDFDKGAERKVEDKKENYVTRPKTPVSIAHPTKILHESSQNKSVDLVSDKLVFDSSGVPSENKTNSFMEDCNKNAEQKTEYKKENYVKSTKTLVPINVKVTQSVKTLNDSSRNKHLGEKENEESDKPPECIQS